MKKTNWKKEFEERNRLRALALFSLLLIMLLISIMAQKKIDSHQVLIGSGTAIVFIAIIFIVWKRKKKGEPEED